MFVGVGWGRKTYPCVSNVVGICRCQGPSWRLRRSTSAALWASSPWRRCWTISYCRRSSRVVAVLHLIVLHVLTLVCLAGVRCSRSRRLGPLSCRCFAARSVLAPSVEAFAALMVLLLGRLLRRFLGHLACRCLAAANVSAPSADALPCRWSLCLGGCCRQCLAPLPCRCFAAASVSAPSADAFAALVVFMFGRMLCLLKFLADVLSLLSPTTSLHCWLPLGWVLLY
jgi:hypothetical protein